MGADGIRLGLFRWRGGERFQHTTILERDVPLGTQ